MMLAWDMEVRQRLIYISIPCDNSFLSLRHGSYAVTDISGGNVAFSCRYLSNATKDELFEVLGMPESEELVRLDGKPLDKALPKNIVKATEWDEWIDEDDEDLRILDFGEAFIQGDKLRELAQPGPLRVPETTFVQCFDHRVDLWRAGCMVSSPSVSVASLMPRLAIEIYAFIFGAYPFQYLGDDDVLVAQMIGFVEELPKDWQPMWECMRSNSKHTLEPRESESIATIWTRYSQVC